jgi:UDPglucose 6-dehydrogenase
MGYDKRIGRAFLNAGVGYGGSCFPKDVDAFIRLSEKSGYSFSLLKEVRAVNEEQKKAFLRLMEDKLWILKGKTIGVLGLAFKADTDDMRCAPSIDIIEGLLAEGAKVKAYDPQAMDNAKAIFKKEVVLSPDVYSMAKGCDCLVLLTEWDEFQTIDFNRLAKVMRQTIVFDGRNFFASKDLKKYGFEYYGIGRGQ